MAQEKNDIFKANPGENNKPMRKALVYKLATFMTYTFLLTLS